MKVTTKLYATLGGLATAGILVGGIGIHYLRTLSEELVIVTERTAVKLDLVNAARARTWEVMSAVRSAMVASSVNDLAAIDEADKQWQSALARVGEQVRELSPLIATEEGRRNLTSFSSGIEEFRASAADFVAACRAHDLARMTRLLPGLKAFSQTSDVSLRRLKEQLRGMLKASQERAEFLRSQSLLVTTAVSVVLLLITGLALSEVRRVNRTLAAAVKELSQGAEQVAAAASQVSVSSQSLAQGASEQAASLQETSASAVEINSMAGKNSEHAQAAANLVVSSNQRFIEANRALEATLQAVGDIHTQSDKVSKIIVTIDEIAFQTNILALNAAVEAARAGESGMGFAVVADEVRNLAQRSAQAAKDTSQLIEESIVRSREGKTRVDQVAVAIRAVTEDAAQLGALVNKVSAGSQDQSRGLHEIGKAVAQMDQVTQATAATAEESASAAEELSAQSEALKQVIGRLSATI